MVDYQDLINRARQEKIPQVSKGLWFKINESLDKKKTFISFRTIIRSAVAGAAIAAFLFFSIGFYQGAQLDNYLMTQSANFNSPDNFYEYLETF